MINSFIKMQPIIVVIVLLKALLVSTQTVCQDGCCESDPRCSDFDFILTACLDTNTASTVCPVTCKMCPTATITTQPTTPTSGSCKDTDPQCFDFNFIITACQDPTQATRCPQMCGLCSVTTTAAMTTTTVPTTTAEVCVDTDNRCYDFDFLLTACLDSEQAKICPKMCGRCDVATSPVQPPPTTLLPTTTTATTTTTEKSCQDTDPQCFDFNFIISSCTDSEKSKQCPQICGLCTPPSTSMPTTTTTTAATTTAACVDTDSRCFEFDFIISACADPVQAKVCPKMCQLCDAS
uniref:Mucin-5AC-like isoform X1 n=2 Tax=Crassostrea virginica TaxID=6565 RepID=A0A8B8BYV9_CRAVI|nr:mucin-5AC-like isoform X1 [Crassostrea virginica]